MKLWKVALLAFAAMCLQDLLSTSMVVFEAHYNALVAGMFDVAEWITVLACSTIAIGSVLKEGWRSRRSLIIIGSVSAANFLGTVGGVSIASALTHH